MNFLFGCAGFAKEVEWLIEEIFVSGGPDYRDLAFVAEDGSEWVGKTINHKPVISETEFFTNQKDVPARCFVGVGSPKIRQRIVEKIKAQCSKSVFPNLIHPSVVYDKRPGKVEIGEGNILCARSVLTTDIVIKDFVHINLACTIGHDTTIDSFSTFSPGAHISGNVNIGKQVFFGTGAVTTERIEVCSETVIGAGAVVVRTIDEPGTFIGSPARKLR